MIDPEIPLASWLLLTSRILFLVVYALPLLFVPMRWARVFRWDVPERTHMTINLGRCLGRVGLAVILAVFRAVPNPRAHRMLFDLIALMTGILALVNVWGAIPRIQPWTEHVEIVLYAGVSRWRPCSRSEKGGTCE